jgi:hypothetical protein
MKTLYYLLIVCVLFPMLLFLNPFAWGMRRMLRYEASEKFTKELDTLKYSLNKFENVYIDILDCEHNHPGIWYYRDCKNNVLDSLENFEIDLQEIKNEAKTKEEIKKHVKTITNEIGCDCYDSLIFHYEVIRIPQKEENLTVKEKNKLEIAKKYGFHKENEDQEIAMAKKQLAFKINNP